ncbi:hypothetical protein BO78DRAFT_87891 [Aspergillus sclerotiicarbonarius CBS 121057]|uniref:Uncharacterized protein n=1 Tax=Aspergillus sclerotiicarbonarius (strain CBS 121057 / IBT 28362) TaxID=1448318 RepID=A0A319EYY6_ASPSB|nr:hypothetical protein BO78DRAFT_87891 [Aspergillus sclerotiicarbonarius CBS 121057]
MLTTPPLFPLVRTTRPYRTYWISVLATWIHNVKLSVAVTKCSVSPEDHRAITRVQGAGLFFLPPVLSLSR